MATRKRTLSEEERRSFWQSLGWDDEIVTKAELVRLLAPNWPSISRDLDHAGRNGLFEARAFAQGKYWRGRAQRWAELNGRWKPASAPPSNVFGKRLG